MQNIKNIGGCSCKVEAKQLKTILKNLPKTNDKKLIKTFSSYEDCSVYKLNEDVYVCESLDYFPMISDDYFTFGQIATCNAISDVYAMGVNPSYVTNILSLPKELTDKQASEIFKGQVSILEKLNISIAGGHSIVGDQLLFGMSVTGFSKTTPIANNNLEEGQVIVISKKIGSGVSLLAHSVNDLTNDEYDDVISELITSNKKAAKQALDSKTTAITDITGFGLIGHLSEMANKDFSIELELNKIPLFAKTKYAINEFYITKGGQANRENYRNNVKNFDGLDLLWQEILCDPQTSGGLAFSAYEKNLTDYVKKNYNIIGKVVKSKGKAIVCKL